jgi:hypothetical protein
LQLYLELDCSEERMNPIDALEFQQLRDLRQETEVLGWVERWA